MRKQCIRRCDSRSTGESEIESTAETETVDGCDGHRPQIGNSLHQPLAPTSKSSRALRIDLGYFPQIGTGRENVPAAGENDTLEFPTILDRRDDAIEFLQNVNR
jgi:hypothetical protein